MSPANRTLLAASAFAALVLSASAGPVEPGKEGALATLVPPRDGARACYFRVYDAAHLAKHPRQKVTEMRFRLAYHVHEPDQFFPAGQRNYYFQLDARLRDQKKMLSASGECMLQDGQIFCGVECDGGGVMIDRSRRDRLLVDLESVGRIRMAPPCDDGEEEGYDLLPGEDDRTFLLDGDLASACPAYEDW